MISGALSILKSEAQRNEMSAIYEKNRSLFLSIAYEKLQNEEEAEDAVQEAFLEIADKPDTFSSLTGNKQIQYMSAVVNNIAINMFNKGIKLQTEELSEDIVYQNDENVIENSFFDKVSREEILAFTETLPEAQRNVLILSYSSGLSADEISRTLNITVSSVYNRLHLARKSIKKYIEERSKNNVLKVILPQLLMRWLNVILLDILISRHSRPQKRILVQLHLELL